MLFYEISSGCKGNNRPPETLSKRECQVLEYLLKGKTNREIARQLHITDHTVKSHVIHIFNKLGVNNRTQAAVMATRLNILDQSDKN